ncbi:hypothetical protein HDE_04630 [Halotydeus destructor]|nr:hypothetical protein HDE_04630 [Halotydeus destructor]
MIISVALLVAVLSLVTNGEEPKVPCASKIPPEAEKMQACVFKNFPEPFGRMMKTCVTAAGQDSLTPKALMAIMCNQAAAKNYYECIQSKMKEAKAEPADAEKAEETAAQICKKSS